MTISKPRIGAYMNRSATDCSPACSNPLTGRTPTKNQTQPTSTNGSDRRTAIATAVVETSTHAAPASTGAEYGSTG